MDRSSLCRFYFDIGASHTDILHFIAQIHGICISMRTLMRHLGVIQKRRKRTPSSIIHAASFIEKKIRNHLHAFRGIPESDLIFEACVYERIEITKDTVEILTKILDPVNTEYRLRRKMRRTGFIGHGPDYIWHVGRFSDLKQCGYSILVCMDGFSGYIILASLFKINDWESEIARFFLKIIKMRKGYPVLMKGNLSTQSDYLDRIQDCLSGMHGFINDTRSCHLRLKQFWKCVQSRSLQAWLNIYASSKKEDQFINCSDRNSLQNCLAKQIQDDINGLVTKWNTQLLNMNHGTIAKARPIVMYNLPTLYSTRRYLQPVSEQRIRRCQTTIHTLINGCHTAPDKQGYQG